VSFVSAVVFRAVIRRVLAAIIALPFALLAPSVSSAVAAPGRPQGTLAAPQTTLIYPDDLNFSYTEYVHGDITHERARFDRPGPFNNAWVTAPDTRANFASDAQRIWMFVDYRPDPCNSPGCGHFWLTVDGVVQAEGVGSDTFVGLRRYAIFQQPSATRHDFSLIFPYGSAVDFHGLSLSGGTPGLLSPPPGRPDLLFVAYGDSITQGSSATGIVRTYGDQVARAKDWRIINLGYGGEWVRQSDGSVVGAIDADLYTVAVGINDYNLSLTLSGTHDRYEAFLDHFRRLQPTAPVYCITPIWGTSEDNPNNQQAVPEDYRQVIRDVVHERMLTDPNLYLIEGLDLVPHDASYFSDGLHPNDAGHAAYAANLEALLPD
jgi:lysophospholipase L1-like esterase